MKRCLTFLMMIVVSAQATPGLVTVEPESTPFWVSKEKVRHRVFAEREVVVAVKTRKAVSGEDELYLQGVGMVAAAAEFVDREARQFENYPKMSSYIKSAQFDPAAMRLKLVTEAFGYEARLGMKLQFGAREPGGRQIQFVVDEGVFRGMNGILTIMPEGSQKSVIVFTAAMKYQKLPMPQFFVEFGLEVALRMMATRMRSYVEEQKSKQ